MPTEQVLPKLISTQTQEAVTKLLGTGGFDVELKKSMVPDSATAGKGAQDKAQAEKAQAIASESAQLSKALLNYIGYKPTLVSHNLRATIQAAISDLDEKLSNQVNAIIHHEKFKQLETAWRGLYYVVKNAPDNEALRIRVLNVSKDELARNLTAPEYMSPDPNSENLNRSPLFKMLFDKAFGVYGGYPYACLIGDYYFDNSSQDTDILTQMGRLGNQIHAPFISGISPDFFGLGKDWLGFSTKHEVTANLLTSDKYTYWRSLRSKAEARNVGLTMPRFLDPSRPQWSRDTEGFGFREKTEGKHDNLIWLNSACAMALNVMRSFDQHGWGMHITGVGTGGRVSDLKHYDLEKNIRVGPLEIQIDENRAMNLENSGIIPMKHNVEQDPTEAVFMGANSIQLPKKYSQDDATASEKLMSRMPYMLACSRFIHALNWMSYQFVSHYTTQEQLESKLTEWIRINYCSPSEAQEEIKMQRPLEDATVSVEADKRNPGYYRTQILLKPHIKFEGMQAKVSLVTRFKKEGSA